MSSGSFTFSRCPSVNYAFFACPVANFVLKKEKNFVVVRIAVVDWTIWKFRNTACFKNKRTQDPLELIYVVCSWINLWSILQRSVDAQERLQRGAALLKMVTADFYVQHNIWIRFGWNSHTMRLEGGRMNGLFSPISLMK